MSKDIRSYFLPKGKTSTSFETIKEKNKNDKSKKKKRTFVISDSDEDDDVKVLTPPSKKCKKSGTGATNSDRTKKVQEEVKSKYFKADASDIFGSAPVKQVVKTFTKIQKKPEVISPSVDSGFESQSSNATSGRGLHDNDDFEAVLSQLDEDVWNSPQVKTPTSKKNLISPESTKTKSNSKSAFKIKKSLTPESSPISSKTQKKDKEAKNESPPSKKIKVIEQKTNNKSPVKHTEKCTKKSPPRLISSPKKLLDEKESKSSKIENKVNYMKSESKEKSSVSFYGKKNDPTSSSLSKISKLSPAKVPTSIMSPSTSTSATPCSFTLWADKYKPQSTKQILGQQGEKSVVNKLIKWLKNWHINQSGTKKLVKPGPWAKDDDGAYFKAALLSGPPGIGKTTTVTLVCQELGFDMVEFNASDTRSKKLLQEEVSELLSCTSITTFFSADQKKKAVTTKNHVLVMDEVDGMAGNEDRGGVNELIQLIKSAKVPVICMCNDRNHPKIRSLVNYCFDLGFHRPRVEQIRGAMMSICFKENLKITPNTMTDIITNSNQDIRSTLNHLTMLAANKSNADLQTQAKHIKLGPWDVLRKVFSAEDHKTMSVSDKSDLFFHDYQVAPLFVQDNYLSVVPHNVDKKNKAALMALYAKAAESLSTGDLIEKAIRQRQAWSLLPVQAMYSSVIPGTYLSGHVAGRIQFPLWFGKNSRSNKIDRLIQEIQVHTRLRMSGSKEAINMDYMRYLRDVLLAPLLKDGSEGVEKSLAALQHYCLTREDFDSIVEISNWPDFIDPMTKIESKVKAAFTRAYNKAAIVTPYALVAPVKKGKGPKAGEEGLEDPEEDDDDEKEDDTLHTDAMIMVKKKPVSSKTSDSSSTGARISKGEGKVRGGGKGSRGGKKLSF